MVRVDISDLPFNFMLELNMAPFQVYSFFLQLVAFVSEARNLRFVHSTQSVLLQPQNWRPDSK